MKFDILLNFRLLNYTDYLDYNVQMYLYSSYAIKIEAVIFKLLLLSSAKKIR